MIITDRTRIEQDWKCPRMRMWLTEGAEAPSVNGWGIVPVADAIALQVGLAYAKGVERMALADPPEHRAIILDVLLSSKLNRPYFQLTCGLLWGFSHYVLPRILEDYDILGIEPELSVVWPRPPEAAEMLVMSRPDMVLRRKSDATIWVPDHKTTKWKDQKWLDKWPYAAQLHLQALAVADAHPEWDVQGSLVFGAYKGYEKELQAPQVGGMIYSPLCGAYKSSRGEYSTRYLSGWDYTPFTVPESIERWVKGLPPDVLAAQFLVSAPIFLRRDMAYSVLDETLEREKVIQSWRQGLTSTTITFPHHTTWCSDCGYRQACWVPAVGRAPLASGFYQLRTPHHSLEVLAKDMQTNSLEEADTIDNVPY